MPFPTSALIADDEPHLRVYLRMILQQLGVKTIHEVKSGSEVMDLYREHRPEVVFLDINMPGKSGLEVLPELLEYDPDAIAIMLTGHASRQLVESSERQGATQYIRKDTPREQIIELLRELFLETFANEE
jgi:DNA-binding NarL/FixJ family response regulator